MSGRKVLMFGLNLYLGLINYLKVIEVVVEVICKYGIGCVGLCFLNGIFDFYF